MGATMRRRRRRTPASIPSLPNPTATFTMTQLAAARRVYQRATKTGGGQNKGQGTIPVTISSATAGTINARCRSVADGTTTLQPEWQAATVGNGATTAQIAGVDARLGWFYLDLKGADGAWKLGTTPVAMGRLVCAAGQSLWQCMLQRFVDNGTSIASAGASINDNGRVLASVAAVTTAGNWLQIEDVANTSGKHNGAGAAELLDRQIARFGVNCGLIGNAVGGSDISSWQNGQANNTELKRIITLAGGAFEAFWWFQGHTMSGASYSARLTAMNALMADILATSSITPKVYVTCIPNVNSASPGTFNIVMQKNRADAEWCAINGGVYLPFADLTLTDSIHPNQFSTRVQAWHFDRASGIELDGSNDNGPVLTRVTKSGVNLVCTVDQASGGTGLVETGDAELRMLVTSPDNASATPIALDGTTPFTIDSPTQFTLKLASDPGDIPLHVWPTNVYSYASDDGAANLLKDDAPGSFPRARHLWAAPVPILRKSNNSVLTGSPVYTATGPFGGSVQARSSGSLSAPITGLLPSWPHDGAVLECWFKYVTSVTGNTAIVTQNNNIGIWLTSTGNIALWIGTSVLATSFPHTGMTAGDGLWHHLRLEYNPIAFTRSFFIDGVRISQTTGSLTVGAASTLGIGHNGGGAGNLHTSGHIAEVAFFNRQLTRGANFSPPSAPYAGNEPGLVHLWHLNGSLADSGPVG